ncbi:MAG TPA: glycoside hydrolase family 11 protein [Polyangiaceae bacterium]|nr:glycoside hydrolase family 11 protein [Polyangiaceae bacterium]
MLNHGLMSCPRQSTRWWLPALSACLPVAVFAGCGGSDAPGGGSGHEGISPGGAMNSAAGAAGASPSGSGAPGTSSAGAPTTPGAAGAVTGGGAPGASGSTGTAGLSSSGGSNSAGSTASGGASAGSAGSGAAGAAGAASTCPTATPLSGGKKYCSNSTGNAGGNYTYELWAEGNGSGCMNVFGVDANFSANWNGVEDFLARIGLTFDRSKTPAQIGTLSADFAETKTGDTGLVYVGIYGWTVDPLREYYILDDWGSTKPAGIASDGTPRDSVGQITVDGAVYDVWKKTRTNKPAITGDNKTFDQYFSIRQSARQCGHISISEHFSKWIGLGLQLGKLVEAKLLLEAQDSTGTIDFTTATVVVK